MYSDEDLIDNYGALMLQGSFYTSSIMYELEPMAGERNPRCFKKVAVIQR